MPPPLLPVSKNLLARVNCSLIDSTNKPTGWGCGVKVSPEWNLPPFSSTNSISWPAAWTSRRDWGRCPLSRTLIKASVRVSAKTLGFNQIFNEFRKEKRRLSQRLLGEIFKFCDKPEETTGWRKEKNEPEKKTQKSFSSQCQCFRLAQETHRQERRRRFWAWHFIDRPIFLFRRRFTSSTWETRWPREQLKGWENFLSPGKSQNRTVFVSNSFSFAGWFNFRFLGFPFSLKNVCFDMGDSIVGTHLGGGFWNVASCCVLQWKTPRGKPRP